VLFRQAPNVDDASEEISALAYRANGTAVIEANARKEKGSVYTSMGLTGLSQIVMLSKSRSLRESEANRFTQSTIVTKIDTEARAGLFRRRCRGIAPVEIWELKQRRHSISYCLPNSKPFQWFL